MTTGIYLALSPILLACAACFVLVPEAGLAVSVGYVIVIIVSNMLLGPEDSRWLTGASILLLIADVILAKVITPRWFIPLDEIWVLIFGVSILSAALLVVALIIRQIVTDQEEYFRQSKLANWEIEKRAATEREQREYLQNTVR